MDQQNKPQTPNFLEEPSSYDELMNQVQEQWPPAESLEFLTHLQRIFMRVQPPDRGIPNEPDRQTYVASSLVDAQHVLERVYGDRYGMKIAEEILFPGLGLRPSFKITHVEQWDAIRPGEACPNAKRLHHVDRLLMEFGKQSLKNVPKPGAVKGVRALLARLFQKKPEE